MSWLWWVWEWITWLFWTLLPAISGLLISTIFLLALFIGFSVIFNLPKLRASSKKSRVIKSLDERVGDGTPIHFLAPDAPRGPADQLHTPELLEAAARKS